MDGVNPPKSTEHHLNASVPTKLDKIHAARVAALPMRNEKCRYEETIDPPTYDSTLELSDRTAAWNQHVQRQRRRRIKAAMTPPPPTSSS